MRPSENWRGVFLLPQSTKKKTKKSNDNSPSPSPQKTSLPKQSRLQQTQIPRRHTMPEPSPRTTHPVQSPDSDVSPKTTLQPKDNSKSDYFSIESQRRREENKGGDAGQLSRATTISSLGSPSLESTKESFSAESSRTESFARRHRGSSISSLAFAPVRNPSLPQGNQKKTDKQRIRASSPPPER